MFVTLNYLVLFSKARGDQFSLPVPIGPMDCLTGFDVRFPETPPARQSTVSIISSPKLEAVHAHSLRSPHAPRSFLP